MALPFGEISMCLQWLWRIVTADGYIIMSLVVIVSVGCVHSHRPTDHHRLILLTELHQDVTTSNSITDFCCFGSHPSLLPPPSSLFPPPPPPQEEEGAIQSRRDQEGFLPLLLLLLFRRRRQRRRRRSGRRRRMEEGGGGRGRIGRRRRMRRKRRRRRRRRRCFHSNEVLASRNLSGACRFGVTLFSCCRSMCQA